MHQSGNLGSKDAHQETPSTIFQPAGGAATESSLPGATATPANAQTQEIATKTAGKSGQVPPKSTGVVIVETDGTTAEVSLESLQFAYERTVKLTSGQSIDFGKIRSIDLSGDDSKIDLRITLTSGEVLTGNAEHPWQGVDGQNRLGSFSVALKQIKRITFPN